MRKFIITSAKYFFSFLFLLYSSINTLGQTIKEIYKFTDDDTFELYEQENRLLFVVRNSNQNYRYELYSTTGQNAGELLLYSNNYPFITSINDHVFISADSKIWLTDGTSIGTNLIDYNAYFGEEKKAKISLYPSIDNFFVALVQLWEDNKYKKYFYKIDYNGAFHYICPSDSEFQPYFPIAGRCNDWVISIRNYPSPVSLYRYNINTGDKSFFANFGGLGANDIFNFNNKVYFYNSGALYSTDGTYQNSGIVIDNIQHKVIPYHDNIYYSIRDQDTLKLYRINEQDHIKELLFGKLEVSGSLYFREDRILYTVNSKLWSMDLNGQDQIQYQNIKDAYDFLIVKDKIYMMYYLDPNNLYSIEKANANDTMKLVIDSFSTIKYSFGHIFGFKYVNGNNKPIGFYSLLVDSSSIIGIENINNNNNLIIFPNPSTGNYTINIDEINNSKSKEIKVYDISGKMILNKNNITENTFDISNYPEGIYFVEVICDDKRFTNKIVKASSQF